MAVTKEDISNNIEYIVAAPTVIILIGIIYTAVSYSNAKSKNNDVREALTNLSKTGGTAMKGAASFLVSPAGMVVIALAMYIVILSFYLMAEDGGNRLMRFRFI